MRQGKITGLASLFNLTRRFASHLKDYAIKNVSYKVPDRMNEQKKMQSSFQQLVRDLDSLGNNFIVMLWLVKLAFTTLQDGDNLIQVKKNLHDALQAGECARRLMRTVLNSQKIDRLVAKDFGLN